jgi:hypothetical protein
MSAGMKIFLELLGLCVFAGFGTMAIMWPILWVTGVFDPPWKRR